MSRPPKGEVTDVPAIPIGSRTTDPGSRCVQFVNRRILHVEDEAESRERRDHRRTAVAHQGQRQPFHGREARRHRDVVDHLKCEARNNASHQIRADAILGEPGRLERSENNEQIEAQRDEHADETLLLREDRKDEVVVGNRQELVLPLRALHEPFALEAAGPDRDPGLDLLVSRARAHPSPDRGTC